MDFFFIFTRRQYRNNGKKSPSASNFELFGKSIAEWGQEKVVHRWFQNLIFGILWFWSDIREFRKDHKMGYTEPFELAISRIDSPMSQLSSGQITASNGASFGTLSAHFDDGLKMSNFKKSSPITQFYRFWHINFTFFCRFFFQIFEILDYSCQKVILKRQIMLRLKPRFFETKA